MDLHHFGQTVKPVLLGGACHEQEAAVMQGEGNFFLRDATVLEEEASLGSEAQGSDLPALNEFLFVVAVPAHAFTAVVVEVEQAAVESGASGLF